MAGIAAALPAWAGPAMTVASSAMGAGANIGAGLSSRNAANYQAEQLDQAAGQQRAASQRAAYDETRRSTLLQSRAQAVAAASGGGASDPTVVDLVSRIAGEGSYRSQLALYQGSEAARALEGRADAARFQGKQAARAGYIGAFSSVLKGASSLFDKYGKGAPGGMGYGSADPTTAGAGMFGGEDFPY